MVLEFFAVSEGVVELLHQLFLLAAQFIRVGGIDCREIVVAKCVFLAIDGNCTFLIINVMQKPTVVHLVLGTALNDLTFEFELND